MNKLKYIGFTMLTMALMAMSAMAATDAPAGGAKETSIGTGLAILGFGMAAGLAGIGQGLAGSKAAEGVARNPGASGNIMTFMIIALALIESLVLFALLVVFTNVMKG
jgi:F-type H+-transporting ATPase subunit c